MGLAVNQLYPSSLGACPLYIMLWADRCYPTLVCKSSNQGLANLILGAIAQTFFALFFLPGGMNNNSFNLNITLYLNRPEKLL